MRNLVFAAALIAAPFSLAGVASAEPQNYVLDPHHTEIAFSVDRFGFNHVLGRFDVITGEMVIDEAAPAHSSVHALVQTASFNSGDTRPPGPECATAPTTPPTPPAPQCRGGRDEHLKGQGWLKVAQFPTMEFRSTAVQLTDATHATVTGELTLMGQTHPLTLAVTLNRIGALASNGAHAAGFTATGVVHRLQYGVAPNVPATLIGDDVNITIEALATQPPPPPATAPTPPPAHP